MNDGELAIEWIQTLAQNEFRQTRNQMENSGPGRSPHSSTAFCCLGVARWVLGMESTGELYKDYEECGLYSCFWRYAPDIADEEMEEMGLSLDGVNRCIDMNDEKKLTFPEIAKHLVIDPDKFFLPDVAEAVKKYFYSH